MLLEKGDDGKAIEDMRQYLAKQERLMSSMITTVTLLSKPFTKLHNALSHLKDSFVSLGHVDINQKDSNGQRTVDYDLIVRALSRVTPALIIRSFSAS